MSEPTIPVADNAAGVKHKGEAKTARIPIKIVAVERLRKPEWIRVRAASSPRFAEIKAILREHNLHTVCEEASCPNIGECFSKGTATFMIMGDICTRRCPFCDVGHGRPLALDTEEPVNLAKTIAALRLKYVVITSVDRDDLRDGGAGHFVDCIRAVRAHSPQTQIEVLVPDFRGRLERALEIHPALEDQSLPINVDGAVAAICGDLGLPPEVADALLLISRIPGLAAHVLEEQQRETPMRVIDPLSHDYDGPLGRRLGRT